MSIQAAAATRDIAASEREAARAFAAQVAAKASEARHDGRIEEAREADAARPRPQDREPPPRRRSPSKLFDVTV